MDAHGRLIEALREHALVLGEVTLTSGLTAQYYVDAKRAILLPGGFLALGELLAERAAQWGATAVGGMTMGADAVTCAALAGGADVKGFFVRKEAKAHGLSRRIEGPLLDAPRTAASSSRTSSAPAARRSPRSRRCRRPGTRSRRRQRARPAGRRRRADRGGRGRALRRARHDRRHLPGAPRPLPDSAAVPARTGRGRRARRAAPCPSRARSPRSGATASAAGPARRRRRAGARCPRASRAAGGRARAGRPRCCARRPPGGPSRRRSRTCPCRARGRS